MSRIRSVHPGFFRDDRLVPCSAFARLLFIGLGVEADDKGIFEWKPVTIKMSIFPGDNVDVGELLMELVDADAIRQFDVAGKRYGAIRNFRKYQKPKTPNDVHPMADGIADYVSLPQKEENASTGAASFPPKVENHFQMEDGGGKGEEKSGQEKKAPPSPQGGGAVSFSELAKVYPHSVHTHTIKAQRLHSRLSPVEQHLALSQAAIERGKSDADRAKRGRDANAHAEFVKGLDTWLREGRWKVEAAEPTPFTPMTRLDRQLDAELWLACERVMGKPAPTSDQTWSFLNSVIEQARKAAA